MTDEERARLREEKVNVGHRLDAIDVSLYRLEDVDQRLLEYTSEVIGNPADHNLWEQLAVERFFHMIDTYGIDAVRIRKFFHFYERLYFPGTKGARRYRLTPVQAFQFASVYGFYHADGRRVVRMCVLFVPRKFSKTTSSAAFALWDLLYGDANAECYIGANSQDQARKCFDVVRMALRKLDNRSKRFTINIDEIKPTKSNPRAAYAQCMTSNARTKDGMNASTVIMDEFSQARDADLLNVLTTSMGVRENPLTVIITTASDVFDGPFFTMLQGFKQVLLGDAEDDSLFAHLFEPDVDDDEESPDTWRKVHPHLGVTVRPDFYEGELLKAKRDGAEAMLAYRTKLLNIYTVNERKSWISAEEARAHMEHINLEEFAPFRYPATVGIDLSVRDDFSAVSLGMYRESEDGEEDPHFYYKTWYFFPREALRGHPNEQLYRKWAEDGHLKLLDGPTIDYPSIVEHILKLETYADVLLIGYDPYKSLECVSMIGTTDLAPCLKAFSQTKGHFTSGVESFEVGLRRNRITIDDNPITAYCFGNAVLTTDSNENMKPEKRQDNQKIDGLITMLMAHKLFGEAIRIVI